MPQQFGHRDRPLPTTPKESSVEVCAVPLEKDGRTKAKLTRSWKPVTLRTPFLVAIVAITCSLIAGIEWLLLKSKRDHGILLAPDINDLPLRRSFCYLYLPTIISVLYGFLWTWIDLDVKRIEPYFQLSKPGGAVAEDSVLLHYPFDFIATVPFKAFKRKHWSVFSISLGIVLISWGLTPAQSGIFAVRTITISESVQMLHATQYTPISEQGNLSAIYAQSVYNIAWLNESLPPFMTPDFVLAGLGPNTTKLPSGNNLAYSGHTTLYSIDVTCEPAVMYNSSGIILFNSTSGCSFNAPPYRPMANNDTSKPYDTMYVGYQDQDGFADWYLSDSCPPSASHTFFVRWSKSSAAAIRSDRESGLIEPAQANATSLFCTPTYYQQPVNAAISMPNKVVLTVEPIGSKSSLPHDMFNTSTFEWAMSSGQEEFPARGGYPTIGFPDQKSHLQHMPLNLAYLPKMAPVAIATYQQPPAAYLDAETLRLSYQAAYRLLFARQMVDILGKNLDTSTAYQGEQTYVTQAVVVVPGFSYATIGLLGVIAALATWLLTTLRRPIKLQRDPSTIASLMQMVKGDDRILSGFSNLDRATTEDLHESLRSKTFELECERANGNCSLRLRSVANASPIPVSFVSNIPSEAGTSQSKAAVRPTELKLPTGAAFIAFQLAALVTFAALYVKARHENGLALPSQSTFVRQLLENYIPVAIASLMEPFWLVLNRLLCLLQPWEELRKGNAPASKSIDLDYNSLPPQFVLWKALCAGHWVLVMVCLTGILAQALAVALSGMFYEDTVPFSHSVNLTTAYAPRIRSLNGTGLPFNADAPGNWQGGTTMDQFYREMSNVTVSTPLPPFIDRSFAYVPVNLPAMNGSTTFQVRTHAFGAKLQCQPMNEHGTPIYNFSLSSDASNAAFTTNLTKDHGGTVTCKDLIPFPRNTLRDLRDPQEGLVAMEVGFGLTSKVGDEEDDLFCRQHVVAGWLRAKYTVKKPLERPDGVWPSLDLHSLNETMLLCKPGILVGEAEVVVDAVGRVQQVVSSNVSDSAIESYFQSNSTDLIAQAHRFLVDNGATWHKDEFPSDFSNYLIGQETNSSRLLDALQSPPSFDEAAAAFSALYTRLFALLIGSNPSLLFEETAEQGGMTASAYSPKTRIFLSTPAFAVTEAILGLYMATTVLLYARRPGRFLPRLPNTIASVVAYFAASHVVRDMLTDTSSPDGRITKDVVSVHWGYGTSISTSGKRRIGIERQP